MLTLPYFLEISFDGELQSSQRKRSALFCKASTFFREFALENIQTGGQ